MAGSSARVTAAGHVTVSHRQVAPPWARPALEGLRSTYVGRESYVEPEPGVLALYRSVWPTRDVTWDSKRQLFVITDRADAGWREFVYEYDAPPDPETGAPVSPEELAAMIESGRHGAWKCFVPFDYRFVRRRMREAMEYLSLGSVRYAAKVADKNTRLGKSWIRDRVNHSVSRLNEIKRYLPVFAGEEKQHLFTGANLTS